MKILSWNILAQEFIESHYYPMIAAKVLFNDRQRQTRHLELLKQADADIILLQEVMPEECRVLEQEFQEKYHLVKGNPIKWEYISTNSSSGNVILVRKSMFVVHGVPLHFTCGLSIPVRLKHSDQPLTILNVHLEDSSPSKRLQQLYELQPLLHSDTHIIIGGDFNEHYTPTTKLYNTLKNFYFSTFNTAPTYYIGEIMCLDHIFLKGFETHRKTGQVINKFKNNIVGQFTNYGSDHLPVLLTVT